jgi:hypothetical protein
MRTYELRTIEGIPQTGFLKKGWKKAKKLGKKAAKKVVTRKNVGKFLRYSGPALAAAGSAVGIPPVVTLAATNAVAKGIQKTGKIPTEAEIRKMPSAKFLPMEMIKKLRAQAMQAQAQAQAQAVAPPSMTIPGLPPPPEETETEKPDTSKYIIPAVAIAAIFLMKGK